MNNYNNNAIKNNNKEDDLALNALNSANIFHLHIISSGQRSFIDIAAALYRSFYCAYFI